MLFYHENRELITARLHRFNLFKRLESSVFSFGETLRRLIERIDNYIDAISRSTSGEVSLEGEEFIDEDITLDYKYEIKVEHLIAGDFLQDLYFDKKILDNLYGSVLKVLNDKRDKYCLCDRFWKPKNNCIFLHIQKLEKNCLKKNILMFL